MWWLGVLSLFLILTLSLFLTRIATMALVLTGLSRDSARFQARSALTGVGFTTSEAEQVVSHPVRRRIIMLLMLLGNAGVVTVMATLIVTFLRDEGEPGQILYKLAAVLIGVLLFSFLARSAWVERRTSVVIAWALKKWTRLDARDYVNLLQLSNEYGVTEIKVGDDDWLAGKSLAGLQLTEEGILILGVYPRRGRYIGVPRGDTVIHTGDVLVVYGSEHALEDLHDRPSGPEGDAAHKRAAARFRQDVAEG